MKHHKEFTFGWLIFAFVIPIHLLLTYLHVNNIGDNPMSANDYIVVTLIFIVVCLLFYGMTTHLTSDRITVSFGIGLIRKRIQLKGVKSVEVVKSPWYYGWGIRMIPNGTLYNISGNDGVQLRFNDTRRVIRIGTKDAPMLKKEIEKRMMNG